VLKWRQIPSRLLGMALGEGRMDEFGNYPREKPFDPFGVMLFKALQVVAFLFFLALLAMNPQAQSGKIDSKAEFIITMNWPDNHPDDIDLYVEDPLGNIAWYHQREAGFLVLDRDDRGAMNDSLIVNGKKISSPIRQEIVSVRGIVPGEYTVNVHYYVKYFPNTPAEPVPVKVKVEKLNPTVEVIYADTTMLAHVGQELPFALGLPKTGASRTSITPTNRSSSSRAASDVIRGNEAGCLMRRLAGFRARRSL
jgi:hypothetical protein